MIEGEIRLSVLMDHSIFNIEKSTSPKVTGLTANCLAYQPTNAPTALRYQVNGLLEYT